MTRAFGCSTGQLLACHASNVLILVIHMLNFVVSFSQAAASYGRGGARGKASKKFDLTEEQKQEIREAFDLFDTDGSGMY